MEGSVCVTDAESGRTRRLTDAQAGAVLPYACVFSPDGRKIAFMRNVAAAGATFTQIFTVGVSAP
jgi:Tol biopolymer transport system component